MNQGWQFILNQTSVELFLSCKAREREHLLKALQQLAADPCQRGDYTAPDSTGRPVQIKQAGRFLFTFWPDSYVKELRVIKIERI